MRRTQRSFLPRRIVSELDALKANLSALLADLMKAKPAASKGHFLQKVSVSTTMGVGIVVEHGSLGLVK